MSKNGMRPVHPGEILREEYLVPMGLSVHGLARYFGTDAQSWLNLQMSYDLKVAEAQLKDRIER